ncbi:uncharacterized protein ELE39_000171 [Cryptosporidium sp. chipmunk genotype I]|uniref:uncharacterized protein n=1 Tax=Cryptosporidium sp. chipmunk genotype I TaxID=1280935 RepID=UPI00351A8466|nr:hypothetical protein ELE39_000171 [Cryptosporidium sp. chipmunk genotype I]
MGESRWMKQTNSKIRVGPEYQAVLPDLIVSEKKTQDRINIELREVNETASSSPSSSSSNTIRATTSGHQGHGSKMITQNLVGSNKSARSEKELSQSSQISTSESNNKPKNSTKTQKTISKTKTNNKISSKSSK